MLEIIAPYERCASGGLIVNNNLQYVCVMIVADNI